MSDSDLSPMKNTRKRGVRNDDSYKVNRIKMARLEGKAHENYRGKEIPAKILGTACSCKSQCFKALEEEVRQHIFTRSHQFKTKDEKDIFVQSHMETCEVQRRRTRKKKNRTEEEPDAKSSGSRICHFKYFVSTNGVKFYVCKSAFYMLFDVTESQVRRLQKLLVEDTTPRDKRGQQNNRKTIPDDIVNLITDHIKSFPVKQTHYGSKPLKYLDARMNIKIMHDLFKAKHGSVARYSFYYKIFKENFAFRFGRPQVDTCSVCEALGVKIKSTSLTDVGKRVAAAELIVHKRRSSKFYTAIKATTELVKHDERKGAVVFDFMQNIPLPTIPVQEIFYLRQLSLYAFGIHDMTSNHANINLYPEGYALRGANEVCSLLLKYLNENLSPKVKELYLFSDNCAGQNKNHTMLRFLLSLTDSGRFEKIIYRLPIRGHSFLPCDRDFALIKRIMRRTDRFYTTKDVMKMVLKSSKNPHKFSVNLVQRGDIYNFDDWWPRYYKKSTITSSAKFLISTYHDFQFDNRKKGIVTASQYVDGLVKHEFKLLKPGQQPDMGQLMKATGKKVPILDSKLQDIQKVMVHIPDGKKPFYNKFLKWPTKQRE